MRETKIYVLRDPRDGRTRYVGKTIQPLKTRLEAHIRRSSSKRTHRDCWIAGLSALGLRPGIECIEVTGEDWADRERFWIAYFREAEPGLTNITAGGDGMDSETASRGWSPERKAEQSRHTAEMNRKRTGTPWTDSRKRQQSESQKRRWTSEQQRASARLRMVAIGADPAYRALQSKAVAAAWTPERKAAQSEVAKKVNSARWGTHQ
jgi:hypothetical protein